ncbi:hypothetical protein QWY31_13980 [Cytophagales bacterium LB-30]|uniref:EpsG family protein n=1 Tax=Shiella aurantiaca TaxID=3058365 RepID=A0ABT8F8N9_9BACT|nr:hypothetical protein [Shiella aurantiaca]MDN4166614.1 hypothetical protein [Shiella aurantiaca]
MKGKLVITSFYIFFSPIMLLVNGVKDRFLPFKKWSIIIFITLYGSTMSIESAYDGYRHYQDVYDHYLNMSFNDYLNGLYNIITFKLNPGSQDVYKHTISYLVGSVFNAPYLFFVIVSFVYAYFFTSSILIVTRYFYQTKKTLLFLGFFFLFLLSKNVEGINTVRTWTGMWILVYACLKYYELKRIRYILLMLVPPLVHVGYFIFIFPVLLFLFIGNRPYLFILILTLSISANFLEPPQVNNLFIQTEVGAQKAKGYTRNELQSFNDIVENKLETGSRLYSAFQKGGLQKIALYFLVYTLVFSGIYLHKMNYYQKSIFSIGLLMLSFSNLFWFNYAVSNRSLIIATVFLLASMLITWLNPITTSLFHKPSGLLKMGLSTSLILFIPNMINNLSALLDFPSIYLFFSPFLVWANPSINLSIKEFIQFFLQ